MLDLPRVLWFSNRLLISRNVLPYCSTSLIIFPDGPSFHGRDYIAWARFHDMFSRCFPHGMFPTQPCASNDHQTETCNTKILVQTTQNRWPKSAGKPAKNRGKGIQTLLFLQPRIQPLRVVSGTGSAFFAVPPTCQETDRFSLLNSSIERRGDGIFSSAARQIGGEAQGIWQSFRWQGVRELH